MYLTIGVESIRKSNWVNIQNRGYMNKPFGGLWACPIRLDGEFITAWQEWCSNEMPHWLKDFGVKFSLKDNARIYTIDSYDDLAALYDKYKQESTVYYPKPLLDFEAISLDFDAIYLTEYGEMVTRFSEVDLYGWDVETLLVLNFDAIDRQEFIKL